MKEIKKEYRKPWKKEQSYSPITLISPADEKIQNDL